MLSHRFAQRIVEEVMARLGHNVNLMDTDGVIIASGEAARVGMVHEGARQALRDGGTVVVRTSRDLQGSLPGVNVPITLEGTTLGVVGVTGPPGRVHAAAASVALTVELMLAQEAMHEEGQWRQRARSQLVEDLVAGRLGGGEWRHRLELVGCRAQPPYLLLALVLAAAPPAGTLRRHLDAAGPAVLVALDVEDVLWTVGGHGAHDMAHAQLGGLRRVLQRQDVPGRLVTAGTVAGLPDLAEAAARMRRAAACAWTGDRTLAELELPVLLAALDGRVARDAAERVLGRLTAVQLETLREFLAADLVISRAARRLVVHRNTLLQRLDAITRRTGRDPRRFADAATFHTALLVRDRRS